MEFIEMKHRQILLKHNREMEERRRFLQELKKARGELVQQTQKEVKNNIGPTWYQVLSVRQRMALDTLPRALYQDILEGRPVKTMEIIRILGIFPRPNKWAVQHCMYLGRNDPKEFLSELYSELYHHPISQKQYSYDLNMRVILSSIFYLGLDDMTNSLKEQFKPDKSEPPRPRIVKTRRTPVCSSPYLQKMEAPLYKPAVTPKRTPPPPLPDLSFLNKRLEKEELPPPKIIEPVLSQPLLPHPKKRIYRAQCDKLAEVLVLQQEVPKNVVIPKPKTEKNLPKYRRKASKTNLQDVKKKYGLNLCKKRKKQIKKPQPPSTGLENVQFNITGVYTYKGCSYYIIGTVYTIPHEGIIVHGGHMRLPNGEYGLIHLGWSYRPSPDFDECECMENWDSAVFRHIQNTKCYCGHRYDFGNEGTYPEEEVPLFVPPTGRLPMQFNYDAIYQMDPKIQQVQKDFKKIWDSESILQEDVDSEIAARRKKKNKKKEPPKPDKTKPCLGEKPSLEDYLRCALRLQRQTNIAACLPYVHRAPELRAWMRRRVHGPYTTEQKQAMMIRSLKLWSNFKTFQNVGQCKAELPSDPSISKNTSWKQKFEINKQFRKVVNTYKIDLYTAQAYANNLLWATTFDAEYPDAKFREIFFTYLAGHVTDVDIFHPYCRYENADRISKRARHRYICLAKGAGDIERY
ncbi:hypothetical protein NE865_05451 [Phthorimaea operculella]|nr:hypothetical protein NE865_05451 [Phthorimaea operculella]